MGGSLRGEGVPPLRLAGVSPAMGGILKTRGFEDDLFRFGLLLPLSGGSLP
jgi:hypothetical protein